MTPFWDTIVQFWEVDASNDTIEKDTGPSLVFPKSLEVTAADISFVLERLVIVISTAETQRAV